MKAYRSRSVCLGLLAVSLLLAACATQPEPGQEAAPPAPAMSRPEDTALWPLLDYFQRLQRMTPQELVRERNVLAALPQTPAVHVRLAILLGQARGPMDLVRAQGLLEGVLKSSDPAAISLLPLTRVLASQYNERLKLEMQNDKLAQQLKDSQRRSGELQEKLEALTDIERSLPVRPIGGDSPPGTPR